MSHERRAPQPGLYIADHRSTGPFLTLLRYRELLRQLVIREVKLRYKRSALGFAWTVLNPLLAMVIFTMVFSRIFSSRPNYSLYVFTALLGWNLFSLGTSRGLDSVVLNGPIIRKVFVPKAIFPVATVVSQVVNFVFTLVPLFLLMAAVGAGFSFNLLWLPIPLVSLTCFALGIAFLVGTFNVFFRDVKYFYEAGLLAWFYATPIFRRLAIETVGGLDTRLQYCMDYELWIRLGRRFPIDRIPYALANSRQYPQTKTWAQRDRLFEELCGVTQRSFGFTSRHWRLWHAYARVKGFSWPLARTVLYPARTRLPPWINRLISWDMRAGKRRT